MRAEADVNVSQTLAQVGLESLVAIELGRWWRQAFEVKISVLEIMNAGTVAELGEVAAREVKKRIMEVV